MEKPLILIDVDGVLNLLFSHRDPVTLVTVDARPFNDSRTFTLLLDPVHGGWLLRLAAETGGELAWGSTWENHANDWVGPRIGLPHLPAAPVSQRQKRSVIPWTAGRRFVWFDDDPAVKAAADTDAVQPHLVILVDERTGLTEEHVAAAREWLLGNKEPPPGG